MEKHHSEIFSLPKTAKSLEPFPLSWAGRAFGKKEPQCVVRQAQRQREAAAAELVKNCHELEDPAANSWLSIASTAEKVQSTEVHPWREPHLFHYD